jgi:hypothetical protein
VVINIGEVIDNRTICDLFDVANMGGIRVCKAGNLIVLISNSTDPTYRNDWRDGTLHFVGRGSTGPQKLDRQNRTLANSKRNGMTVHLFEVFEKSRYVYAGEVELAREPYMSDQVDARADSRFVWILPLRIKATTESAAGAKPETELSDHLPHGAYAVIGSVLTGDQVELVNEAVDRLRLAGVPVTDQRDVDRKRYDRSLAGWNEAVLDRVRSTVRRLIAKRQAAAKAGGRGFAVVDDELRITSASSERELRDAMKFLDRDDPTASEEIFEEARRYVPMPEPPKSLQRLADDGYGYMDVVDQPTQSRIVSGRFKEFK